MTKETINRVSSAIRRLATAASHKFGCDCYLHAAIGQAILAEELGIESRIAAGFAAWRVGTGDGDTITHWATGSVPPPLEEVLAYLMYHTWLEVEDHILDLTTYQLVAKGRMLDAQDGGKTNVQWCPDYLYIPKGKQLTLHSVVYGDQGDFSYNQNPIIESLVAKGFTLDPVDVHLARVLYQNPDCMVIGPNDVRKTPHDMKA